MKKLTLTLTLLSAISISYSQNVGINTDGSAPGKMLDIKPTTNNDGIRINNTAGDAIINLRGNGTDRWTFGFDDSDGDNFVISSAATLGTAADRFEIDENDDQIRSGFDGTAARPAWGFTSDENTGIYRSAIDELAFSAGGIEFLVFDEGGTDVGVFNEDANDIDFRFEGSVTNQLLYIDYGNEAIGISTQPDANNPLGITAQMNSFRSSVSVGDDGNTGDQLSIGLYLGPDPAIIPEQFGFGAGDGYGYVGWNGGYDLFQVASNAFVNTSLRSAKRRIAYVEDGSSYKYLYDKIDQIKPAMYKYNGETDEIVEGRENRYRPMGHIGLIVEDAPDFLKSASLNGIDLYSLSTFSLVVAKQNKTRLDNINLPIHGEGVINDSETSIKLPRELEYGYTVVITPHGLDTKIAIKDKLTDRFVVESNMTSAKFDYVIIPINNLDNNASSTLELTDEDIDMLTVSDEEKAKVEEIKSMNLLSNKKK